MSACEYRKNTFYTKKCETVHAYDNVEISAVCLDTMQFWNCDTSSNIDSENLQ